VVTPFTVLREYGYMPGVDHPYVVRIGAAGTPYYYLADGQGNISRIVNGAGQLVQSFTYDPWGRVLAAGGTSVAQPLRENGRTLDAETGLYYNRGRYYDPELGRFISEDPAGLNGGLNAYAFAMNDPVNFRDPSGMGPCVRDWVVEGSVRDANEDDGNVNPLLMYEVWDCSGWLDWYEAWQSMQELVDWATSRIGKVVGAEEGDRAVEVWAEKFNDAEGVGKIVPGVMGTLASLWTTDTWAETAITLGTAGLGTAGSASTAAPRVFWSGGGAGGAAYEAATAYATATGGVTLEMTAIGRGLARLDKVLPTSVSGPLWRAASWNFARGAQGPVHAFHAASGVRLNAFWVTEYKQLTSRGVNIIFHTVF
jgi:RHS repeat-associated protein